MTPGPGSYRPPSDFGYLDFKAKDYATVDMKAYRSSMLNETMREKVIYLNLKYVCRAKVTISNMKVC